MLLAGSCLLAWAQEAASIARAMQLVAAGKLDQAATMLAQLEQAEPRNAEVAYRFGLVLLRSGKLAEARPRLERAAKLNPQIPYLSAALGLLHDSLAKEAAAGGNAP